MFHIMIQARSTSSRLPGKSLMDLHGEPVLMHVVRAARQVSDNVVVLCPDGDDIGSWCHRNGIVWWTGDERDVLSRYVTAARVFHATAGVMRLTADCPLLSVAQLYYCRMLFLRDELDYCTNLPFCLDGHDCEILSPQALDWLDKHAVTEHDREHVTTYLWDHLYDFVKDHTVTFYSDSSCAWQEKLSLDTQEDHHRIEEVIKRIDERHKLLDKRLPGSRLAEYR